MSNAIVPVVPKRNAVTGAGYPTSLALGELAVNTTTGSVYLGADPGVVQIGVPVAAGTVLNLGTGNGSTVAYTIAGGTGTDAGGYLVSVGGIDQPSGWTIVGTTLTFSEAPPAGAAVSVRAILKGEGGGGGGTDIGGRAWSAGATYTQGDLVATSQRETWICIQNSNTGHDPVSSPEWWAPQPADAVSLQLRAVATTAPVAGQILSWRNSAWTPWGHMYAHSTYWSDDETLVNGSYLWLANFTDAVAANVSFGEGLFTISTNANGVVTKAYTYNHPYQHDIYWSNDQTLENGSILFTEQHNNIRAANVSFIEGDYQITTNGSGLVTKMPISTWYGDSSDIHHAITLTGNVTQSDEGSGVKVADFSGGYLNLSASDLNSVSGDFTFETFIKPIANDTYRTIASLGDYQTGILLRVSSNGAADNLYIHGNVVLSGNNSYLTQNYWNHIALVRYFDTFSVYVNGLSIANIAFTDALDFSAIYIGTAKHATGEILLGYLAGVRLVIGTALYTSNFTVPTTLPTAVSGTQLLLNFEATAAPTV